MNAIGRRTADLGPVHRASGIVWCVSCQRRATVSVVERAGGAGAIRYVQWCSLLGCDLIDCNQECLGRATARE